MSSEKLSIKEDTILLVYLFEDEPWRVTPDQDITEDYKEEVASLVSKGYLKQVWTLSVKGKKAANKVYKRRK